MSNLTKVNITMSIGQRKKLANAMQSNSPLNIRLSNRSLTGEFPILMTRRQMTRMTKAKKNGTGMVVKMSASQMRAMKKDGGIAPLAILLPLGISLLSGLIGGIANIGGKKIGKKIIGTGSHRGQGFPPAVAPVSKGGFGLNKNLTEKQLRDILGPIVAQSRIPVARKKGGRFKRLPNGPLNHVQLGQRTGRGRGKKKTRQLEGRLLKSHTAEGLAPLGVQAKGLAPLGVRLDRSRNRRF